MTKDIGTPSAASPLQGARGRAWRFSDGLVAICSKCRYQLERVNFGWYCRTEYCLNSRMGQMVPMFVPVESTAGCTLPSPP